MAAKQSLAAKKSVDCFVASLHAMTVWFKARCKAVTTMSIAVMPMNGMMMPPTP